MYPDNQFKIIFILIIALIFHQCGWVLNRLYGEMNLPNRPLSGYI
ncbi:hypothetical protein ymoll0001_10190 [Yersinia mollaretii ATCC 43969]|uniref:Uncharacterized protein n=1 Tax=Yersinia mollaretii (strain ATCC 43969 / DSM 18520 / CIP 103324 / CNY 7263 / WAIP 204) TaxID=349967 RepID=A0ABP2EIR0_YERMW|nr:hypothetical protein ymoll0001_10190 [Yersinia mollaretii ATCC 43969]